MTNKKIWKVGPILALCFLIFKIFNLKTSQGFVTGQIIGVEESYLLPIHKRTVWVQASLGMPPEPYCLLDDDILSGLSNGNSAVNLAIVTYEIPRLNSLFQCEARKQIKSVQLIQEEPRMEEKDNLASYHF